MIYRYLYQNLLDWKTSDDRKPIILHGVRQVGKTTLVHKLGESYDQYLYFNLERPSDRASFTNVDNLDILVPQLLLEKAAKDPKIATTLIFIDEVQEIPRVIEQLRYFYEDYPHIHVIVTGSLLAFGMDQVKRVPVGRVEYWYMYPVTFEEFLIERNAAALNIMGQVPLPEYAYAELFKTFHEYTMIGGMPEVVDAHLQKKGLIALQEIYQNIIKGYFDDVEKYARNTTDRDVLRAIITTLPSSVDTRINMNNFGNSGFRTREVKAAMRSLEKTGIIELKYPTTNTQPPILPHLRKKPRLHFFDVGLMNSLQNIQAEYLAIDDLHHISKGALLQQVIYQELKTLKEPMFNNFTFWVREEGGTSSEVDIVYPYKNHLIPIEIKSGASGRLRSLHEFMDRCPHDYAVRIYGGPLKIEAMISRLGKDYHLLNLPYFLTSKISAYLDWFVSEIESN